MLLIVKDGVLDDDDDAHDEGAIEAESLKYDSGAYATGNTPCRVHDWVVGKYVRVTVTDANGVEKMLRVPLTERTRFDKETGRRVVVHSFGLKPYQERVVDLAQGLEYDGVVHVQAERIFGKGKFYVAITRAKALANLKISGVGEGRVGLRRVMKSNWRAVYWLDQMGEYVPGYCVKYALACKKQFDDVWGRT
eukprot:6603255-Prymnesium_polylepis.1